MSVAGLGSPGANLPGAAGPVIAQVGAIRVTSSAVWTPAGVFALRGSEWTVTDQWATERRRPGWAVVLAIVAFPVLPGFSLLFLRVRRTVVRGAVVVAVRNGPYQYAERIPVADQAAALAVHHRIRYARSLAAL
ncbi:MAG: hypothetical protein IRZ05_10340 [Micromonosporaceae bacterium]|nr:hypothetical protein [Micromonosporaceae bacterium]